VGFSLTATYLTPTP
jgi:dynein heavy chain